MRLRYRDASACCKRKSLSVKVVFLNAAGEIGGAESVLLDALASLRGRAPDWSLHLITPAQGLLVERARSLKVKTSVIEYPMSVARLGDATLGGNSAGERLKKLLLAGKMLSAGAGAARYIVRLRRALRELSPDVVHSNGLKMHILGAHAAPSGAPLVWHMHDFVSSRPAMSRLIRFYAARCATAVAISDSVAADVRNVCGERVKVAAVHNAIDLNRFTPEGARLDLDALAGLPPAPEGTVRVGLIGTMARWKGQETFLRALARLDENLPVRGYIVGGALYKREDSQWSFEELKRIAASLGVSAKVGFTGFVAEPAAAMRALDVVVHASTQPEPFGLVIAEAMACGRAVIASNGGGAAEIIQNGAALSHTPGDEAGLAARIAELVTDRERRSALGSVARASVVNRYDRVRLAEELIPIYERLAANCKERRDHTRRASAASPFGSSNGSDEKAGRQAA